MVKIYLIRHGQTDFNVKSIIAGQIETDLTALGRRQALEAAQKLKSDGVNFDVILCSTLKRAKDTAEIIASILPAPIVYDEGLKEFSNGIFEGLEVEKLKQMRFNPPYHTAGLDFENGADLYAAYSSFDPKYDTLCYPEGETKQEARERFMRAIEHYLQAHPDIKNLGVVAHGAVIRFMLLKVCPETLKEKIKNAEARLIHYEKAKGFYA